MIPFVNAHKQIVRRNAERFANPHQCFNRNVSFSTLHTSNLRKAQFRKLSQLFLRYIQNISPFAYSLSNLFRNRHPLSPLFYILPVLLLLLQKLKNLLYVF